MAQEKMSLASPWLDVANSSWFYLAMLLEIGPLARGVLSIGYAPKCFCPFSIQISYHFFSLNLPSSYSLLVDR